MEFNPFIIYNKMGKLTFLQFYLPFAPLQQQQQQQQQHFKKSPVTF